MFRKICLLSALCLILTGCASGEKTAAVSLPDAESVISVSVSQNGNSVVCEDPETIEDFLAAVAEGKAADTAPDKPDAENTEGDVRIDILYSDGSVSLYPFSKDGRTYIEIPDQGTYEADGDFDGILRKLQDGGDADPSFMLPTAPDGEAIETVPGSDSERETRVDGESEADGEGDLYITEDGKYSFSLPTAPDGEEIETVPESGSEQETRETGTDDAGSLRIEKDGKYSFALPTAPDGIAVETVPYSVPEPEIHRGEE